MFILHIKRSVSGGRISSKQDLIRYLGVIRFATTSVKNNNQFEDDKPRPKLRFSDGNKNRRTIGPFGWFLLMVPVLTFCLGTWQVRRKAWKEQLLVDLRKRRDVQPVPLPDTLDQLNALEYYPIHVRGTFVHNRHMFVGPRTLLLRGTAVTEGNTGLMSGGGGDNRQGYLLVTPFQLEGKREMILVNRGWVPASYLKNKKHGESTATKSESNNVIDLVGLLRLSENRPPFMPQQQSTKDKSLFIYRDIDQMAARAGDTCASVFLDATDDLDIIEPQSNTIGAARGDVVVPIANQTRLTLRNEHLSYVLTWYGLSFATTILWYRHFLIKR